MGREESGECVLSTPSRLIKFTTTLLMSIAPIHLNDDGVIFPVPVHFLDLPFSDMWYMVEVQ